LDCPFGFEFTLAKDPFLIGGKTFSTTFPGLFHGKGGLNFFLNGGLTPNFLKGAGLKECVFPVTLKTLLCFGVFGKQEGEILFPGKKGFLI